MRPYGEKSLRPISLFPGMNTFFLSQRLGGADHPPLRLTVVASDHEDGKVIISQISRLPAKQVNAQRVDVKLPETIKSRAIDLEVVLSGADGRNDCFGPASFACRWYPRPKSVTLYHLPRVEDEKSFWKTGSVSSGEWTIRDFGPMLMSESYPMALAEGRMGHSMAAPIPEAACSASIPPRASLKTLDHPAHRPIISIIWSLHLTAGCTVTFTDRREEFSHTT